METVTKFTYEEVQEIIKEHVRDRTMNSMLKNREIRASAPYGEYKVTISEIIVAAPCVTEDAQMNTRRGDAAT